MTVRNTCINDTTTRTTITTARVVKYIYREKERRREGEKERRRKERMLGEREKEVERRKEKKTQLTNDSYAGTFDCGR